MLKSYRKGALALAAAMTFSAGAAQADNHVVLIVDGSYFPSVIFASAGDNIIFRNESGSTHVIQGADESWTSGNIGGSASYRLNLTRNTPATFSGTGGGYEEAFGEIIFEGGVSSDG